VSPIPTFALRVDEATELGELCDFVCEWLGQAPAGVAHSLATFVSAPGYDLSDLRADCRRFSFLLGVATSPFLEDEEAP
jgi:hypothetical protein